MPDYVYASPIANTAGAMNWVGAAQDLRLKYPEITPHAHLELSVAGTRVDPSSYFEWR